MRSMRCCSLRGVAGLLVVAVSAPHALAFQASPMCQISPCLLSVLPEVMLCSGAVCLCSAPLSSSTVQRWGCAGHALCSAGGLHHQQVCAFCFCSVQPEVCSTGLPWLCGAAGAVCLISCLMLVFLNRTDKQLQCKARSFPVADALCWCAF